MDRPFLLQLQCLLSRMTEGVSLCSNDVDIIDRSYSTAHSSEMANLINEIYALLAHMPLNNFWESFSAMVTHSRTTNTRIIAHSILASRIRKEWPLIDPNIREGLKQYVVERIDRCLCGQEEAALLNLFNQVLVSMLRFEWASLFKDFVSNMEQEGLNAPIQKVLNNLTVLSLLLEEGFNSKDELVSPSEMERLQASLEQDMRTILKFLCLCLHNQGQDRIPRIRKCLETIKVTVDYIPAFELFNCNLIQLLVGLIGAPEFHSSLTTCFEEIFRFKEANTSSNSHSKIAKKLLLILESYLAKFERTHSDHHPQDKESASTEDSFQSRKTRRNCIPRNDIHAQILPLLYQFLTRYVPYMDKARGEEDLQIEFEGNLKLYFSQDLYDAFGLIYWQIIKFLHSALEKYDPFLLGEPSENIIEECRKMIGCIRLMINMLGKLKLEGREDFYGILERTITNFTPLSQQFTHYYLAFSLLQYDLDEICTPPFYSIELEEQYKEFIKTVLREKQVSKIYFRFINQRVNEIVNDCRSTKEQNAQQLSNMQKWASLRLVNTVNRISWSSVYAYNINQDLCLEHQFGRICSTLAKGAKVPSLLARCFGINCKFTCQIYESHSILEKGLLRTLETNYSPVMIELTLLILSKVLTNERLEPYFTLEQLNFIFSKLQEWEKIDEPKDKLLGLYASLMNLIALMYENADTPKAQAKLKDFLLGIFAKQLNSLEEFSKDNGTKASPNLYLSIYHFKKLTAIANYIRQASKTKAVIKNCSLILKWARNVVSTAIVKFQFKYKCFSEYLLLTQKDNFDIAHILSFRTYYLNMQRSHASLCIILSSIQAKESKSPQLVARERQRMLKMITAEAAARADFIAQKQFKPKEYFQFALEVYKLLIVKAYPDFDETINQSINAIMNCLEGWDAEGDVLIEKYNFWREVIKFYLQRLEPKNMEHLIQLFSQFQLSTTQFHCVQAILDVFETLLDIVTEDCLKNGQALIETFIQILMATFEKLFSKHCERQSIFERVAHLLYREIEFVSCLSMPLKPNSRKDNMEIIYLLLQNHIVQKTGVQFDQQHCFKLQRLFQQRQFACWSEDLKEEVVYLMRSYNGQCSNRESL